MSKWTFNEEEDEDTLVGEGPLNDVEEDEDTLVEEGPQIERGTVFHRDTCHREIHQRNIRGQATPA